MTNTELRIRLLTITRDASERGDVGLFPSHYIRALSLDETEDSFYRIVAALRYLKQKAYIETIESKSIEKPYTTYRVSGVTASGLDFLDESSSRAAYDQDVPGRGLTVSDIRSAYQSQLPERRDAFREEIKRLKSDCSAKDCVLSKFIYEVATTAKREMRARYELAMECVKVLLDDGWRPADGLTVDGVYRDIFQNYTSIDHETFSDLTSAVTSAFADIGNNGPDICASFGREIADTQVSAYNKCVAQLRIYRPASTAPASIYNAPVFNAPVGAYQQGNLNSARIEGGD